MEAPGAGGVNAAPKLSDLYSRWAAEPDEETDGRQTDLLGTAAPVWVDSAAWVEGEIKPRPWIARGYLMRGAVSVLSGPGSAGKSSLMVGWAIAASLGVRLHRFVPQHPCKVFLYNVEDDREEQQRRMSATLRQFDRNPRDLAGNVVRIGPNGAGTLLRRDPISGRLGFTAAMRAMEDLIREQRPDVLVLDPLVELHDAEENDNTAVRAVMAKFRAMAVQYNMAIVLIHHSRKGVAGAFGDPDSLRGASAIVGAARIVLTVLTMDEDTATKLNIAPIERGRYFRVDGAKSNYAPLHEAEWFQRVEYELDNGEAVAAAVPWEPPSSMPDATPAELNAALDEIDRGPSPGVLYTASNRGGGSRWAGRVLIARCGMSEPQARALLATWVRAGLLHETHFHHPEARRQMPGVRVDDSKRPTV